VLLTAVPEQRLMVVEVGTNALGEIPLLTAIVAPDAAVLTLIDLEHTEGLGDLDGIEAEEGALLAALAPNAVAVGNVDDPRVRRRLAASPAQRKVGYGTADDAAYRIVARSLRGSAGSRVSVRRPDGTVAEATASLLGLPGALAVTAGLAVVESVLGRALTPAELSAALAGDDAREPGRLTPVELADGTLVLDDTYNANPGSMSSSVAAARELAHERGARLVLVLGEMRELGARSPEEHHRLGATLKAVEPALVVGVGGDAARLVAAARSTGVRADFAADVAAAAPLLRAGLRPGDVVLIKASRGLRAERLVTDLLGTSGGAA
jgi:UDP-N-acetylmuramoyl-tripeptide--D-alanyl-D-alanine ligase